MLRGGGGSSARAPRACAAWPTQRASAQSTRPPGGGSQGSNARQHTGARSGLRSGAKSGGRSPAAGRAPSELCLQGRVEASYAGTSKVHGRRFDARELHRSRAGLEAFREASACDVQVDVRSCSRSFPGVNRALSAECRSAGACESWGRLGTWCETILSDARKHGKPTPGWAPTRGDGSEPPGERPPARTAARLPPPRRVGSTPGRQPPRGVRHLCTYATLGPTLPN